jgi:hypothetical protein
MGTAPLRSLRFECAEYVIRMILDDIGHLPISALAFRG